MQKAPEFRFPNENTEKAVYLSLIDEDEVSTERKMVFSGNISYETSTAIRSARSLDGMPPIVPKSLENDSSAGVGTSAPVESSKSAHGSPKEEYAPSTIEDEPIASLSPYKFETTDPEFCRSYLSYDEKTFGFGCTVSPTKHELRIYSALVEMGNHDDIEKFETAVYQSCLLRSRAFRTSWELLSSKITQVIKRCVKSGSFYIRELLKFNDISGTLLQVILADVGVEKCDRKLVLDILYDYLEESSSDSYIFLKLDSPKSVQEALEQLYSGLRSRLSSRSGAHSENSHAAGVPERKGVVKKLLDIYRRHYSSFSLVVIFDRLFSNTCELFYAFQLLKRDENMKISCILCATCWQAHLESYCSLRVYSNLAILNCDVIAISGVCDSILKTILWDSDVQCFIPNFQVLQQIWDIFYDVDMSITSLVKRLYTLYENYYSEHHFSFINMPHIVKIDPKIPVPKSGSIQKITKADLGDYSDLPKELLSKFALLCIGSGLSESHSALLELKLGYKVSVEKLTLNIIPKAATVLFERRISLQLGLQLLFHMLELIPDCQTARRRLDLIASTFSDKDSKHRISALIKRITKVISLKEGQSTLHVIQILREYGNDFRRMYPCILAISKFMGRQEIKNLDLFADYGEAVREGYGSSAMARFVYRALNCFFFPIASDSSSLASELFSQRFCTIRNEWSVLEMLQHSAKRNDCNILLRDLDSVIRISRVIPAKSINLWDLFCLFYTRVSRRLGFVKLFLRFTIAIETLVQILGFYTLTNPTNDLEKIPKTRSNIDISGGAKLPLAIKSRLQRFKAKCIHLRP